MDRFCIDETRIREMEKFWMDTLNCNFDIKKFQKISLNESDDKYEDIKVSFNLEVSKKISKLCNNKDLTIFAYFSAVVNIVLYKLLNSEVITVGIPAYNYHYKNKVLNPIVPLVSSLTGKESFKEVLINTSQTLLSTYNNQNYKLNNILRDLGVKTLNDLLVSHVIYTNIHDEEFFMKSLEKNKGNLIFKFSREEDLYRMDLLFNKDSIEKKILKVLVDSVEKILESSLENINEKISDITLLSEEDKVKLSSFNNTSAEFQEDLILDLFEKSVENNKDKTALTFKDESITYKELKDRADKFASYLLKQGVKNKDIAAISIKRGINQIVAILGVLKAGAAYLPLDVEYPKERVKYILEDSKASFLITEDRPLDEFRKENIKFITFDKKEIEKEIVKGSINKVKNKEDLAYIIYTSGTTGKPKGVMVCHESIANSLIWRIEEYSLKNSDVTIQLFSYVFDGFITSFFTGLLSGCEVVLIDEWTSINPKAVLDIIKNHAVTNMIAVPTMYESILNEADKESLKSLRLVTLAGEKLNKSLVKLSKKINENIEINNEYGPTENSVVTSVKRDINIDTYITIGKPIKNTRIHIVDEFENEMPIGIEGEICIAGKGLAKGYLNNEALTLEKFRENVLEEDRLYHTSDLGRWSEDGEVEYLGRKDEQIKIRGFRVELFEIEKVLLQHKDIEQAVVTFEESISNNKELSAYLKISNKINAGDVKSFLEKYLPNYMIPKSFYEVNEIPMTPAGKVNKRVLKNKGKLLSYSVEFIDPRNEIEEKCLSMWKEILSLEKVGIKNDFFEMGGYSLLAAKFLNQVFKEFGVEIPISYFFENSTIEMTAKYIKENGNGKYEPILKAEKKEYYEMTSSQKRIFIVENLDKNSTTYNMPAIFKIKGKIDIKKIRLAFKELVARHEVFRTAFYMKDSKMVQKVLEGSTEVLEFKVDEYSEEKVKEIVKSFIKPFNLEKGFLVRAGVITGNIDNDILMFDMHHIIGDGYSMNVLVKEFIELYEGKELPPLSIQYKDYSEWLVNKDLTSKSSFWKEVFKDKVPLLNIPLDFNRGKTQSFNGSSIDFRLEEEYIEKLNKLCKDNNVTEFMVFLAVYVILLSEFSGDRDIVVGSPLSGRVHRDTENMIGMFASTLPFRCKINKNYTYSDLLRHVKKVCLKVYENQEYPLEDIISDVGISRDMSRNPLFDVMFVMQDSLENGFKLDGMESEPLEIESSSTKFDLSLGVKKEEEGYDLSFQYSVDLFKESTIKNLAKYYKNIINSMIENANMNIFDNSVLKEEEKENIIKNFSHSALDKFSSKDLMDLFEENSIENGEKIALKIEDEEYTYSQVNLLTESIKEKLTEEGITEGDVVILQLEKSLEAVIGIYAVLKIGAAFVLLDPTVKENRINYIIEDSKAKAVLVKDSEKVNKYKGIPYINVLLRESLNKEIKTERMNKSSIAYINYDNTLGIPRGKAVSRDILNSSLIDLGEKYTAYENHYGIDLKDSNKVFITAVLTYFVKGGSLSLTRNIEELSSKVTHLIMNPYKLNLLLKDSNKDKDFKYFFPLGEELESSLLINFNNIRNRERMIYLYSPIGNMPYLTAYEAKEIKSSEVMTAGKPSASLSLYILSQKKALCGVGMTGDLYVGGHVIMLESKKEENQFIKGGYMYNTGIKAAWNQDGNIKIIYKDNLLDIRAVENEIKKIPKVLDAVVVNNDGVLNAFVVTDNLEISDIKEELYNNLPSNKVPKRIEELEYIPRLSSGKADFKEIEKLLKDNEANYVEPKTEVEKNLAEIWRELLKIDRISIEDAFFDIGGDSLKSIQLLQKINEKFQVNYEIVDIFKYVTIAAMAKKINEDLGKEEVLEDNIEKFEF